MELILQAKKYDCTLGEDNIIIGDTEIDPNCLP